MTACPNCGFSETIVRDHPHSETLPCSTVTTDPCQQLADLETETTRLKALLHQAEQQKALIKRQINARRSSLLRLPPEITSEIFTTYLPCHDYAWDELDCHSMLLTSETPLLFGRICSAWRKLAWSTPRLWCFLLLNLEQYVIDPVLVEQWINRSCGLPLSIWAFLVTESDELRASDVAIMHLIAQQSQRWCNIALKLPSFCYESFEYIKGHLPNLQYVSIDRESSWQRDESFRFMMFSDTPQLRSLIINGFDVLSDFAFSTDNLTKLCIERQPVNECLKMLQRSPRLTECAFLNIQGANSNAELIHTLADQLESLSLIFCEDYPNEISDLFDALTIPAVRELSFQADGLYFPHSSLISLVTRSSCSLQTLTFKFIQTSDDELLELFRIMPSLEKLRLTGGRITDETLRMLSRCDSDVLLPNLKAFERCSSSGSLHRDFPALVGFLRSRWDDRESNVSGIARLQSVAFRILGPGSGMPDPVTMAQLRRFVQEGMEIKLVINQHRLL
jgi:hypothetical protein